MNMVFARREVINELTELRLPEAQYMQRDGRVAADIFLPRGAECSRFRRNPIA